MYEYAAGVLSKGESTLVKWLDSKKDGEGGSSLAESIKSGGHLEGNDSAMGIAKAAVESVYRKYNWEIVKSSGFATVAGASALGVIGGVGALASAPVAVALAVGAMVGGGIVLGVSTMPTDYFVKKLVQRRVDKAMNDNGPVAPKSSM